MMADTTNAVNTTPAPRLTFELYRAAIELRQLESEVQRHRRRLLDCSLQHRDGLLNGVVLVEEVESELQDAIDRCNAFVAKHPGVEKIWRELSGFDHNPVPDRYACQACEFETRGLDERSRELANVHNAIPGHHIVGIDAGGSRLIAADHIEVDLSVDLEEWDGEEWGGW